MNLTKCYAKIQKIKQQKTEIKLINLKKKLKNVLLLQQLPFFPVRKTHQLTIFLVGKPLRLIDHNVRFEDDCYVL